MAQIVDEPVGVKLFKQHLPEPCHHQQTVRKLLSRVILKDLDNPTGRKSSHFSPLFGLPSSPCWKGVTAIFSRYLGHPQINQITRHQGLPIA
jgi:hypothetical protein